MNLKMLHVCIALSNVIGIKYFILKIGESFFVQKSLYNRILPDKDSSITIIKKRILLKSELENVTRIITSDNLKLRLSVVF